MRIRGRSDANQGAMLRAIPLFERCTDAELRRVEELVDHVDVAPGEVVTSERAATAESYVILSGEASVVIREHSVERLTAGDVFGDVASLMPGRPSPATVMAITPMRLLAVETRNLDSLVAIPSVAQQLARVAVASLQDPEYRAPCH